YPGEFAVMEIEDRVTADGGKVGHVAPESDVSEEMRVLVQPGVEAEVAGGRIDVELFIKAIQTEPALPEYIERFAPIYPEPAGSIVERGARLPEGGGDDEIAGVSRNRVPIRKREVLVVEHLANDSFELVKHEEMPRQEVPLLIMLRVGGVVGVGLAAVPHRLGHLLLVGRE